MDYDHTSKLDNPKSPFLSGYVYLETARFCYNKQNKNLTDGKDNEYFFAQKSLSALSAELFFKAIVLHEKGTYPSGRDGHNLKTLFNELSEEVQKELLTVLRKYNIDKALLEGQIFNHESQPFPRYRYSNEYMVNGGDVTILINLSEALGYVCAKLLQTQKVFWAHAQVLRNKKYIEKKVQIPSDMTGQIVRTMMAHVSLS